MIRVSWLIPCSHPQKDLIHELGYFTEIGIGSPPQYFQVLLDVSAADSFISSVKCESCLVADDRFSGYNSTASSTYHPDGTPITVDYGTMNTSGIISRDTVHFGGLEIHQQSLQEAMEVNGAGPSWDDRSIIHGILGLTPSNAGSVHQLSNPFVTAVAQGILDSNVFALRLAEEPTERMELMVGGINRELFTGEITHLPVTNKTSSFLLTGRWQTPAKALALGPSHEIEWSLDGYTAAFSTMWPFIYLPDRLAWDLNADLEFEDFMFIPPSIDCKLRDSWPDVTLNLAGHDFVLSPYDYTLEWPIGRGQVRCVSVFSESGLDEADGKEIVLGSAFLRKFYVIFDWASQTVGCEYADALHETDAWGHLTDSYTSCEVGLMLYRENEFTLHRFMIGKLKEEKGYLLRLHRFQASEYTLIILVVLSLARLCYWRASSRI